jgi:hypothetical protein
VTVTLVDCRVGREEVKILCAFNIPNASAYNEKNVRLCCIKTRYRRAIVSLTHALGEYDGKRVVVVSAVSIFELNAPYRGICGKWGSRREETASDKSKSTAGSRAARLDHHGRTNFLLASGFFK